MGDPEEPAPSLAGVAERLLSLLETGSKLPEPATKAVRAAYDELVAVERARRRAMLEAVRADLEKLDVDKVPGGRTYQATALWLADVIDKRGADEGPSTTAKLADQLTKVMQALTRKGGGDDDGFDDFQDGLSTPVA
jgi:hypothetical protein